MILSWDLGFPWELGFGICDFSFMSNDVQEIKQKIDIVGIVSEYVKLTPAGSNFRGLCPFHNEKTPSFMVSADKQIWHCFGCAKGGDAFTFIQEIENCEFAEALRILAQKAGIEIKKFDPKTTNKKTRLLDINELAAKFFHYLLLNEKSAQIGRDYISKRLLSSETVEDFSLGYSPNSWDTLFKYLKQRGFFENEIFDAGLAVKKDKGSGYYDRFRNRLMFPIKNIFGQVVGFTARVLDGDEKTAKYINTPQTLIYNKSQVIYGLDKAKQDIRKKNLVVVVEGNMDVISSHQAGIRNVVASSGTAFTDEQVALLKRYSNNLALSFDADNAGQAAASRGIDTALKHAMNISVITLEHKDPDDCIKDDPKKWESAISNARPFMEYILEKILKGKDLSKIQDKKNIANSMLLEIKKLGDIVEQDFWIQKLASILDISDNILRESINSIKTQNNRNPEEKKAAPENLSGKKSREKELYESLFSLVLYDLDNLNYLIENLDPKFIVEENFCKFYKYLILYYNIANPNLALDKNFIDDFIGWLSKEDNVFCETIKNTLNQLILLAQKDFSSFEKIEITQEVINLIRIIKKSFFAKQMKEVRSRLIALEALNPKEIKEDLKDLIFKYRELAGLYKDVQ